MLFYIVLIGGAEQSRAHHNSYKCSLQLAAHLVPFQLPDSPDLTGNRKGAVTGYDELLENGAMNGNIWYTGCLPVPVYTIQGVYNTTL